MGDYSHAAVLTGHEDDSLSQIIANDIFMAKAYIFKCSFDELAPYLPWSFENYQEGDIFRIQNLTALLSTQTNPEDTPLSNICSQQTIKQQEGFYNESYRRSYPPCDNSYAVDKTH
jgi:hypothetical protein